MALQGWLDPGMAPFLSAVGGAVVGSLATYLATGHLERVKRRQTEAQLHSALLVEVIGHGFTFNRDFDAVLPRWLRRGEPGIWNGNKPIKPMILGQVSTNIYMEFRSALLCSDLAEAIASYYHRAQRYNSDLRALEQSTYEDYISTIRDALRLAKENLELTADLIRKTPKNHLRKLRVANTIASYEEFANSYRLLIAIAGYKYYDLLKLREQAESQGISHLPPPLNKSDDWFRYLDWAQNPS